MKPGTACPANLPFGKCHELIKVRHRAGRGRGIDKGVFKAVRGDKGNRRRPDGSRGRRSRNIRNKRMMNRAGLVLKEGEPGGGWGKRGSGQKGREDVNGDGVPLDRRSGGGAGRGTRTTRNKNRGRASSCKRTHVMGHAERERSGGQRGRGTNEGDRSSEPRTKALRGRGHTMRRRGRRDRGSRSSGMGLTRRRAVDKHREGCRSEEEATGGQDQ